MVPMRVIKRDLKKGILTIKVDGPEDLYWLSFVIRPGDLITARTTRRFKPEGQQRPDSGERVPVTITLEAEKVEVDSTGGSMRILGVVRRAPDWLGIQGKHHSIEISPGSQLTISKDSWDDVALDIIERAEQSTLSPKVLVIVLDDREATVATISRFKVTPEVALRASKRADLRARRAESIISREFFSELSQVVGRLNERYSPEAIIIAGPGFFKEEFAKYLSERLPEVASKIRVVDASSATLSGVYEVLKRGEVDKVARELSVSTDAKLLEKFLADLSKGSRLIAYGPEQVKAALAYGAVETLLISSRTVFDQLRMEFSKELLELCKRTRAEFRIVDSETEPGQVLDSLGGVIAFLRFPIEE